MQADVAGALGQRITLRSGELYKPDYIEGTDTSNGFHGRVSAVMDGLAEVAYTATGCRTHYSILSPNHPIFGK